MTLAARLPRQARSGLTVVALGAAAGCKPSAPAVVALDVAPPAEVVAEPEPETIAEPTGEDLPAMGTWVDGETLSVRVTGFARTVPQPSSLDEGQVLATVKVDLKNRGILVAKPRATHFRIWMEAGYEVPIAKILEESNTEQHAFLYGLKPKTETSLVLFFALPEDGKPTRLLYTDGVTMLPAALEPRSLDVPDAGATRGRARTGKGSSARR
jgi:hypothetical protein